MTFSCDDANIAVNIIALRFVHRPFIISRYPENGHTLRKAAAASFKNILYSLFHISLFQHLVSKTCTPPV